MKSLRTHLVLLSILIVALPLIATAIIGATLFRDYLQRQVATAPLTRYVCVDVAFVDGSQVNRPPTEAFGCDYPPDASMWNSWPKLQLVALNSDFFSSSAAGVNSHLMLHVTGRSRFLVGSFELSLWPFIKPAATCSVDVDNLPNVGIPARPADSSCSASIRDAQQTLDTAVLSGAGAIFGLLALVGLSTWFTVGCVLSSVEAIRN